MNKKRAAIIAVIFFLLQIIPLAGMASAESLSPNLPLNIAIVPELIIENFGVTIHILPDINGILNDCKIKPNKIYYSFLTDSSA